METIEDYIVNRLFKEGFQVEVYSSNGVVFGSDYSDHQNYIDIYFDNHIGEKIFKSIRNYTRDIFQVKNEGFKYKDYTSFTSKDGTFLACDYKDFDNPSILICLSDKTRKYINKKISKYRGYKVEYPIELIYNDEFNDILEDVLDDILHNIVNLLEEGVVFSFKTSVCDKFSNYIWRRLNLEY